MNAVLQTKPAQTAMAPTELAERKRRVKRAAFLLGLVAASFYVGFIVLMVFRGSH
jgi:uncharacterized membrane protein (DUF485 family)